jgi:hypothetical protein
VAKVAENSETAVDSVGRLAVTSHARARDIESVPRSELTATEQRIDEIIKLMCDGQWITATSCRVLAESWGLSPGSVEQIAVEASRTLRRMFRWFDDGDAVLGYARQSFQRLAVKAERDGNYRDAILGIDKLAEYTGKKPSAKLEVQLKSPEQLQATLEQWLDNMPPEDVAILNRKGWFRTIDTTAEASDADK